MSSSELPKYESYKGSGVGWIGLVPESWQVKPLKYIADIVLGKMLCTENKGGYFLKPYLKSKNIQWLKVDASSVDEMWFSRRELELYRLRRGDLVLSEGGEVGKTCLWQDELEECYIQNSAHLVRLKPDFDSLFFLYQMYACGKYGYFDAIVNRVSIAHLTHEKLANVEFAVPVREEQLLISKFLDKKNTQIDEAIAIKEQQIALLKERKQIIIQKAVTQGLDPTVPMKDSGVDWIGEIPAHWSYEPIKYSLHGVVDCEHKTAPFVDDNDFFVVRTSNVKNGKLVLDGAKYTHEKGYKEWTRRGVPKIGDVLLTREAPAGEACLVPEDMKVCLGQRMVWLRINRERLIPDFVVSLIYSSIGRTYIDYLSSGSTVLHFNMADINNIPILLPPLDEQKKLVAYISDNAKEIDHAIEIQIRQIERLKEYKTTLINSAVTGKIRITPDMVEA